MSDYVAKRPHERQKLPGKSVTYTPSKKTSSKPKPTPKKTPILPSRVEYTIKKIKAGRYAGKSEEPQTLPEMVQKSYEQSKKVERAKDVQQRHIQETERVQRDIVPTGAYEVRMSDDKTVTMTGVELKAFLTARKGQMVRTYRQLESAELQSQKGYQYFLHGSREYDPETKVVETEKGYEVRFPYAGAEKYRTYKKAIEQGGLATLGVTATSGEDPLGLVSAYQMSTGQKEKAIQTKIKAIHQIKTQPFSYYVSSPFTVIGTSYAAGAGIGAGSAAVTGRIAGRYGAGSLAMWGFKFTQAGVGGAMIGLTAADVHKSVELEGVEGLIKSGTRTGIGLASGIAGYKVGRSVTYKGESIGKHFWRKGFEKRIVKGVESGKISPTIGSEVIQASKFEKDLLRGGLGKVKIKQAEPDFSRVGTLKKYPKLQEFFAKHTLRRKAGIYGSLSEGREDIHDIDLMYRNLSKGYREAYYGVEYKEGVPLKSVADIKPYQRVGTQVSRGGIVKYAWYKTPKGYRLMRIGESAMRHGESALELAHPGRVKDIPRSVELYTRLYKGAGSPIGLKGTLEGYADVMARLEKTPLIMGKKESLFTYGGRSLAERWAGLKTRIWGKLPEDVRLGSLESSYRKTMGITPKDIMSKTKVVLESDPTTYGKAYPFESTPEIYISKWAIRKGHGFTTGRHEMQHILHPSAPEWSIRIAEKIPHRGIDTWVAKNVPSVVPPSPSLGYIGFMSYPSSIMTAGLGMFPYITRKHSSKSIKRVQPSIIKISFKSIKVPSITRRRKTPSFKKSISPKTIKSPSIIIKPPSSSVISPTTTPSTPTITAPPSTSITPTSPSISPSISPYVISPPSPLFIKPGLRGRGRRFSDFSLYGKKYKFRMVKIPDPFKGGI